MGVQDTAGAEGSQRLLKYAAGDAVDYANLIRLVHEKVGDDLTGFRATTTTTTAA